MASNSRKSTRRQVLGTVVAVACCSSVAAKAARNTNPNTVDQITDVRATAATNMFRFEPDLVRLSPGEELTFLNSRGDHTVHSVPEIWPEGVPPVAIAHRPEVTIRLEREGFYGFRCRRHGQYGMVMLAVVGAPIGTGALRTAMETRRPRDRERIAFLNLLDRYEVG